MNKLGFWLCRLAVTVTILFVYSIPLAVTAQGDTPGVIVADLKDQLEKGLKARRPQEFAFIARVVTMVENEVLPLELVKSTFQWARKHAQKEYPFPYFERALRERAAKIGVAIP